MLSWFEKHNKISWTITIIIAAIIFYLSSLTFPPGTGTTNIVSIIYHFVVFFFFALFLSISTARGKKTSLIPLAIIISILYGISDEVHQLFIPGRSFAVSDMLLNTSGILLASTLYLLLTMSKLKTLKKNKNFSQKMNFKEKVKKALKKFWFLLWKDESLKGWVFSIIVLFIFIKFIFFPVLSLITGTSLPLAIVESCSMYHKGNLFSDYNEWWQRHETKYEPYEIDKETFRDFVFKNGFNKGDILFIIKAEPEKLKVGDVIIFNAEKQHPLIHRIIEIKQENGEYVFSTIGDNNNGQLSVEKNIKSEQLVGKAVFKLVPYLGWGKLVFFEQARPASERGFCEEN